MMVVQIVLDSVRADAPGFAGGEAETPAWDQLAAEGTRLEHAVASGAWTIPSLLAMVTGTEPHRLGISHWRHPFPARRPSLLSAFAAAGFEVHVASHEPRWVLGTLPHRGAALDSQEPAEVVAALRGPRGRDRFVLIHHRWTHLPYEPRRLAPDDWRRACDAALRELRRHPERAAAELRARSLRAVEHASRELLGRYVDAASAGGGDVLVAITADHGEDWGEALPAGRRVEHVSDLHGRWFHDATTLVPLVWWGKAHGAAVPAGAVLGGTARGVDLAPTIAELAGVPWPGPLPAADAPTVIDRGIDPDGGGLVLDGRSLAPALRTGRDLPDRPARVVTSHNAYEPGVYPADPQQAWPALARRDGGAWTVLRDGECPAGTDEAVREELLEEWHRAVGPGPELDPGLFPADGRVRDPS